MNYRQFSDTNEKISEVGLGCWAIGGVDFGKVNDNDSIYAIQKSIDTGINFIDTADVYGYGHSEEIVGKAIKGRRENVFLATKIGFRWEKNKYIGHDSSRKYILEGIDKSLKRLQTDFVDLYQIHCYDSNTPIEETAVTLLELQKKGKIRFLGVSNYTIENMSEWLKYAPLHSTQPEYSMFEREIEGEYLNFCEKNKISVVVYSPLAKGLLTGKFNKDSKFSPDDVRHYDTMYQGERFLENLSKVERLKEIAKKYNKTIGQLAIAWVLRKSQVTSAIVGAKTYKQVQENIGGSGWEIKKEDLEKIEQIL